MQFCVCAKTETIIILLYIYLYIYELIRTHDSNSFLKLLYNHLFCEFVQGNHYISYTVSISVISSLDTALNLGPGLVRVRAVLPLPLQR